MESRRVLLIGGSLNQTSMMHKIGRELPARYDCFFTPFFCDGFLRRLKPLGLLDMTILAGRFRATTDAYLRENRLPIDEEGAARDYDLVLTCSDLVLPRRIRERPIVLVQEGMTDPENFAYRLVRTFGLPRWMASTSTTGLSLAYRKFCVASEGYRDFFISKGIPERLLAVTGIPNFDDCAAFRKNNLPMRDYVLVCTSDARETFKLDNRRRFLRRCVAIAGGRPLVFKLHPNENWERASAEIRREAPRALVFTEANTNDLVANCCALITQYSSVIYVGLALGKECHSYFDLEELRRLVPIQNGGTSAERIAEVCEEILDGGVQAERRIA
ncbi:MAG: hypothetical protein ACHQPI_04655 [Thermoanaerobaculia bacterium]